MSSKKNNTTNTSNFTPKGRLGALFAQARMFNQLNDQLSTLLPDAFKTLSLCTLKDNTATFVTHNQAVAFRAQKQQDTLLDIIRSLGALSNIQIIIIKVDLTEH
ncbi:MAG: hypothetical protein DSZ16_01635 [Candidatus Thioglobus sp.]|nr:MAG: hypothetical protein DSZ14_05215 [Candidatus Thioglobus sp.]RUM82672.1 MAG: hypothetical protein DSZ17_03825 [Candidatus Thioglobus sp.]RUM82802.1 MAG: hypothetical protein DSZ16_01635 [Candidatus Thioglobus sp.]